MKWNEAFQNAYIIFSEVMDQVKPKYEYGMDNCATTHPGYLIVLQGDTDH